jgi:hypothetical protein
LHELPDVDDPAVGLGLGLSRELGVADGEGEAYTSGYRLACPPWFRVADEAGKPMLLCVPDLHHLNPHARCELRSRRAMLCS